MKTQVKALKVKIKSLAAEAKIIRLEEKRVLGYKKSDTTLYLSLRSHRTNEVRREQRAAMLAYGFIRGRTYRQVEKCGKVSGIRHQNHPDWNRVRQLAEKFGGLPYKTRTVTHEELTAWHIGMKETNKETSK